MLDLFIIDRVSGEDTEQVRLARTVSLSEHDVAAESPPDIQIYLSQVRAVTTQLSAIMSGRQKCSRDQRGSLLLHLIKNTLLLQFDLINIQQDPPDSSSHLVWDPLTGQKCSLFILQRNSQPSHLPDSLLHLLVSLVSDSEPLPHVRDHRQPLLLPRLLLVQPFLLERGLSFILIQTKIMDEAVSVVVNVMDINLCFLDIIVIFPASLVVDHN